MIFDTSPKKRDLKRKSSSSRYAIRRWETKNEKYLGEKKINTLWKLSMELVLGVRYSLEMKHENLDN